MRLSAAFTVLVLAAAAGLLLGYVLLAAAAAFVGGLWALAFLYGQDAYRRLAVEQVASPAGVAPGGLVDLTLTLSNPTDWPLPVLDWQDDFPDSFELVGEAHQSGSSRPRRRRLFGRLGMARRERVRRRVVLRPSRRGRYVVGPVEVRLTDPLGIVDWELTREAPCAVTVYPKLYPVPSDLWRPALPSGERRGPPWNPPDPLRLRGTRPYQPGDPPRLIHPYATARTGTLQVKQLETEAEDVVELVVLAATAPHIWDGIEADRLEALVSAAASAAHLYLSQKAAVGLTLAGSVYGSPRGLSLAPARGAAQREKLLTALAWAQPGGGDAGDLSLALTRMRQRLSPGIPVLVLTTFYDPSWQAAAERVARRSGRMTWVAVAWSGPEPSLSGVPVFAWTPGPGEEVDA